MHWAKLEAGAPFNLASSGVLNCALADLGPLPDDLALHGPNPYGYPPFVEGLAARFGIDPACVVTSQGASMANHLAFAALLEPGDEVLVEDPTYELMLSALGHLGADLRRFQRPAEAGFALDAEAVRRALTPRTRLVVLTNLHNPTSVFTPPEVIQAVVDLAAEAGATVLIDEVYLELTFGTGPVRTAFTQGANVVVTSSLTKAYGLSGLRAGWILAQPDLAERMRRLNDLYGSVPVFLAEQLAARALGRLQVFRDRADALLAANRKAWRDLVEGHPRLDPSGLSVGTTLFPRLVDEDADTFIARLRRDHDTSVAPGRFFERPDRFRVGLAGDPANTRSGLERLARALETG
jgi:aspartate/methionine/tyrosine aminotransferase